MPSHHEVTWLDRGHRPRQPPHKEFPYGCHLDMTRTALWRDQVKLQMPAPPSDDEKSCLISLPYPTRHTNVGTWMVKCLECGLTVAITAASRADDPRTVRLPCRQQE